MVDRDELVLSDAEGDELPDEAVAELAAVAEVAQGDTDGQRDPGRGRHWRRRCGGGARWDALGARGSAGRAGGGARRAPRRGCALPRGAAGRGRDAAAGAGCGATTSTRSTPRSRRRGARSRRSESGWRGRRARPPREASPPALRLAGGPNVEAMTPARRSRSGWSSAPAASRARLARCGSLRPPPHDGPQTAAYAALGPLPLLALLILVAANGDASSKPPGGSTTDPSGAVYVADTGRRVAPKFVPAAE